MLPDLPLDIKPMPQLRRELGLEKLTGVLDVNPHQLRFYVYPYPCRELERYLKGAVPEGWELVFRNHRTFSVFESERTVEIARSRGEL